MIHSAVLFFCVFFAALTPYLTFAMTDEQKAQVRAHFEEVGAMCIADYPITGDDIANIRKKQLGKSENAACFIACMMKKIGVMDDQGMLQKDTALELVKKVFETPEEVSNIGDFLHSCNHGLLEEIPLIRDK